MKNVLFLILMVAGFAARGESGLSLTEAENLALSQSPEIKILKLERDSASWQETKALSSHIPHLDLVGSHVWDNKFEELEIEFGGSSIAMPAITPYTILSAQASWMIFDGLASWHQYQAARLNTKAKDLELSRGTLRLKTQIRTRFYQALGAQALQVVADQNIKTLEQHLSDVNSQHRAGASTRYDILRIEVQLEEARTEKLSTDDNLALARARLFEALGIPDDGRKLEGRLPENWDQVHLSEIQLALQDREDRQAQILREESSADLSAASKGAWFPRVSLFANKDWYNNINSQISGGEARFKDAYAIGINFKWNLFDGGASYASQKQAALAHQETSEKLRALNDHIPVEFETWKRKLNLSIAAYKARLVAIKKAEESVRLAKNGIRVGVRTNTEVLDAEMDLNNARAKAVRSQMDAVEALGELELATGRSITHF